MLGHGAGIDFTGPGPRMGPTDNFSLVTGSDSCRKQTHSYIVTLLYYISREVNKSRTKQTTDNVTHWDF